MWTGGRGGQKRDFFVDVINGWPLPSPANMQWRKPKTDCNSIGLIKSETAPHTLYGGAGGLKRSLPNLYGNFVKKVVFKRKNCRKFRPSDLLTRSYFSI